MDYLHVQADIPWYNYYLSRTDTWQAMYYSFQNGFMLCYNYLALPYIRMLANIQVFGLFPQLITCAGFLGTRVYRWVNYVIFSWPYNCLIALHTGHAMMGTVHRDMSCVSWIAFVYITRIGPICIERDIWQVREKYRPR